MIDELAIMSNDTLKFKYGTFEHSTKSLIGDAFYRIRLHIQPSTGLLSVN